MLNLIDFSLLLNKERNKDKEENKEDEKEKEINFLKQQIILLQQEIEKEKNIAFKEGFEKGKEETEKYYKSKIEEIEKEKEEKIKEILNQEKKDYQILIDKIHSEFDKKYKQFLNYISQIITDSLADILDFLYIEKAETKKIVEVVSNILEELRNEKIFKIVVSKDVNLDILKKAFSQIEIEIDDKLEGIDFILKLESGKIENIFKEKIEIIKDEIKREIKKLSEV